MSQALLAIHNILHNSDIFNPIWTGLFANLKRLGRGIFLTWLFQGKDILWVDIFIKLTKILMTSLSC